MADSTTPKRVLPARERRESFKLQASSPPPIPPTSAKKPSTAPSPTQPADQIPRVKRKYVRKSSLLHQHTPDRRNSTPGSEEVFPTKVVNSKPLPTTRHPPGSNPSVQEYQSIAESAILAASLHRSRTQWLCDGVFKRYWTKPSKRKGAPDIAANNPDQKSMQKLGSCSIVIEPHTFDAIVYTVRDPQASPIPYYRHPNQYPPKQQSPFAQQYPTLYNNSPNATQPAVAMPLQPPNCHQHGPPPPRKIKQELGSTTSPMTPAPQQRPPQQPTSQPRPKSTSTTSTSATKPNADPVIQMLASRAASDPRLKDLMKVVATSKASPAQLKEFQSHIDEFNAIIKRDEELRVQKDRLDQQSKSKPLPQPAVTQLDGGSDEPQSRTDTPPQSHQPSASHPASYTPGAFPPPQVVPLRSGSSIPPHGPPMQAPPYAQYPPPQPRPEPLVKHIVLELTTPASSTQPASQDRWLFPEYAVLDTPHSGRGLEMVCSFFVERKGAQIIGSISSQAGDDSPVVLKWKPDVEYYQSVTMILKAPQHRTLETIARAAKPLLQVQEYMIDVMKKKVRAPQEYLVLQLPRDKKIDADTTMADFTDSAVDLGEEDDELKEFYGN